MELSYCQWKKQSIFWFPTLKNQKMCVVRSNLFPFSLQLGNTPKLHSPLWMLDHHRFHFPNHRLFWHWFIVTHFNIEFLLISRVPLQINNGSRLPHARTPLQTDITDAPHARWRLSRRRILFPHDGFLRFVQRRHLVFDPGFETFLGRLDCRR